MSLLPPLLQELLVCPQCHGKPEENENEKSLLCHHCNLAFAVDDEGIPNMLIQDAKPIQELPRR